MARGAPKGHPRYGGREKGTLNKSTQTARELAESLGVCPLTILLHFAAGNWQQLGYPTATKTMLDAEGNQIQVDRIDEALRQKSAKDALPYIRPTLKSVELTGADGQNAFTSFASMVAALVSSNGELQGAAKHEDTSDDSGKSEG